MNDDSVHLCINGVTWQHQLLWCDPGMMSHMPLAVTACCTDYNPSCMIQSGSVLRYCLANSSTLAQAEVGSALQVYFNLGLLRKVPAQQTRMS